jgi:hypothetical protein
MAGLADTHFEYTPEAQAHGDLKFTDMLWLFAKFMDYTKGKGNKKLLIKPF